MPWLAGHLRTIVWETQIPYDLTCMQNLKLKKQNRWVTKWPKKVRVQLAVLRFEAVNIQPDNCAKTVLPSWKLLRTDHSSSTQEKFSDYVWWLMDHSDHFPTRTKSCCLSEASITCALVIPHYTGSKNGRKVKPWPQEGCFSRMRWPTVHEFPVDNRGIYLPGWGFSLEVRYGHLHLFKSSGWPLEGSLVFASQRGLCSKECLSLSCLAQR